jgi:uncharacterized protein (TIRG00374 family)
LDSNAKKNEPRRTKLIVFVRILFAIVALVIVIRSVQFADYVEQGGQKYRVVSETPSDFRAVDASGHSITVARTSDIKQVHRGAISLAKNMHFVPALWSVIVFSFVAFFLAYRWQALLKVQGVHIPFWTMMRLTFAGNFLNFFLIGTTGGDLVKAYWIGRFSPKRAEGFISVFVDRFIGLVVLILLAAVLVVLMWHDQQVARLGRAVGSLVVLSAVAVVFLFSRRLRKLIRFDRWKHKLPISQIFDKIDQALLAYRKSGGVLIKAALATVMLQLLASTSAYFLGSALDIHASLWYYWLYVPLAFLIGSIPVSIFWGLGLLEGAYIAFFNGSGFATVTQAAMLAMAVRLLQLLWALPGSFVLAAGIGTSNRPASFGRAKFRGSDPHKFAFT